VHVNVPGVNVDVEGKRPTKKGVNVEVAFARSASIGSFSIINW
jgi:hypothetical protein